MSFGALSPNAVRALSRGAGMAGCYMSTGEGSLSPYHLEGNCDILYQIGPAKFGCRTPDGHFDDEKAAAILALPQVKMVEIKLAQGAKPGKGGVLPKEKITEEIAAIRGIPHGRGLPFAEPLRGVRRCAIAPRFHRAGPQAHRQTDRPENGRRVSRRDQRTLP